MLTITIAFSVLLLIVIILFAFPKLSPIPYFPSNPKDISLIVKGLDLKNKQVILDLGAGDGIVIFMAASESLKNNLDTEFIAIETNPVLLIILCTRKLLHPNRNRIHIVATDLFKANYKALLYSTLKKRTSDYKPTFYIYISYWLIKDALMQVQKTVPKFRTVSYYYPVPFFKETKKITGKNAIFIY